MELKEPKVKAGAKREFKRTELGMIPVDWDVQPIGPLIELLTGFPFPSSGYTESGVRLLRCSNIKRGETDWEPNITQYWPRIASSLAQYAMQEGDLVIAMDGSLVGKSFARINKEDLPALLLQRVARIRSRKLDVGFLTAFVGSDLFVNYSDSVKTVTAIPHISPSDIRNFTIPVPPTLAEQHAIATALSDVDGLIAGLEGLLAKKRALKQGAMQQLLSGQKRLPGFTGEWGVKRLGEICELTAGTNKPLSEMGSGALYVTVQDLYNGISISTERLGRMKMTASELEGRTLSTGDVVMGKSSVKREGIGYPSLFLGCDEPVIFSGFTFRVRARKRAADSRFIFYALRWDKTRQWLIDNSQASALTNINRSIADRIPIQIPELEEQIAIGQFLFDMDAELTALEAKLGKTRLLKQGMMQELLTGRVRLV
jgi:type I restriction enzyme S subunit